MSEQSITPVRAPSAAALGTRVRHFVELWLGGMFLKTESYAYQRDQKNPFGNGLVYITVVGVIVALAGMLGAGLRYATSPTQDAIKNTVLVHLQAMPFYNTFDPNSADTFNRGFERTWDLFGSVFVGYPTNPSSFVSLALSILTTPLGLVIGWVIYGALVHLVARGWNPETSLAELLAPLALASSPQLIHVLGLFPDVNVSSLTIALWTFVCNIIAIRIAYQTTGRRAVWGALFPLLLLLVLIVVVAILAIALFAGARRGG